MHWSDIQFRPPDRLLRQFAGLWLLFFGALACWLGLGRGGWVLAWPLGIIALAGGAFGFLRPQTLRPIYVGWMVVAFPVGWLISKVILGFIFYGVFTPLAVFFRLRRRDALLLRRPTGRDTYWTNKAPPKDVRNYFHQS